MNTLWLSLLEVLIILLKEESIIQAENNQNTVTFCIGPYTHDMRRITQLNLEGMYTYTHLHTPTHTLTYIHTHTHTYLHTPTHTYTHIHTLHTYTHIHTGCPRKKWTLSLRICHLWKNLTITKIFFGILAKCLGIICAKDG